MATWPPENATIQLKDLGGGVWGSAIPTVLTARLVASRTSGVSPMTVTFSAAETTDPARDSHEVLNEVGYYFDFDDATSGTYTKGSNVGGSRNTAIGNPITSHTFIVADGGGSVEFDVLVRVKNPEGQESLASVTITCQAQDDFYSAANTIAISNTLSLGADWTIYDTPAPLGATKQATLPDWDEFDGKRIMLFKSDDFSSDTVNDIIIRMGQNNCVVTFFGDDASAKPIVDRVLIGSAKTNGSFDAIDQNVTDWGWTDSVTIDSIEPTDAKNGITFSHVGYYNCNIDSTSKPSGGSLFMSDGSNWVYGSNGLTPSDVPFPIGCYVDRCITIGSTTSEPLINIGAFNSPYLLWSSISEHTARYADEHNCRIMSWQNLAVHDNDMLGDHVVGTSKHRITIRAQGYNEALGDMTGKNFGDMVNTFVGKEKSSLACVVDNACSPGTVGNAAAGITVTPSNTSELVLIDDVIIGDNTFATELLSPSFDIQIASRYTTTRQNTYHTGSGGTQDSGNTYDIDAIVDLTPNFIDASAPPIPTAPR